MRKSETILSKSRVFAQASAVCPKYEMDHAICVCNGIDQFDLFLNRIAS